MNWQVIVRNQWFQLCLAAALCSAGAGIYDLATSTPKNSSPTPGPTPVQYITPRPSLNPTPVLAQLRAKNVGHWIVDASGAGDSDSRNLSQVVGSAANGDTITIRPGRYEVSLVINKDLAFIGGGASPAETMIFFNRDQLNVVHIEAGHVTFSNLQIEQDFNTSFAALYCVQRAHVELANCSVTSKSTFGVSVGGDAQFDARDSAFSTSEIGNGVSYYERAHGTVTRCRITGNKFGLDVENQSRVNVDGCTFQYNGDQNGYGGPTNVDGSGATLEVEQSNFSQNSAGIYVQESGSLTMTGCTLENNGISLEGTHTTGGLICVQTAGQAKLNGLVCKFNKQGISVLAAGKAELNNVNLSDTGIPTNNTQYIAFCNTICANGDGTTVTVQKSSISNAIYNGFVVMNGARVLVTNSSVSNCKYNGFVFGPDNGAAGYGTITDSTVFSNHISGIFVQSNSSVEITGGEISNNANHGLEVSGNGSAATVNNVYLRNQLKAGMMAYNGGMITARHCSIEKNQIGVQAGLPETGRESAGTILLESCVVQNNNGYGAISCAGSVINLTGNRFQNGRYDYLRQSGGSFRNVGN
jgi:Right handed beta helix region